MNMTSIAPPPAGPVCERFNLGAPDGAMTRVEGGLTHRMWRLDTTRGSFAVKDINRDWSNGAYTAWYERAFSVEMHAYAAGIAMPRPVAVAATGACLAEIAVAGADRPMTVRVHEWVDAQRIAADACGEQQAAEVGGLLAGIHALAIVPDGPMEYATAYLRREHWRALASSSAESERAIDAEELAAIDEIIALIEASPRNEGAMIMSHRDSDAKNVLRARDGTLMLIDWDATGPIEPRQEIAKEAIVWGGGCAREPDPSIARALVSGYRRAGGVYDEPRAEDLAEFFRVMLGWLEFNMRRASGERSRDDADRLIGEREARGVLGQVQRWAASADAWARLLG